MFEWKLVTCWPALAWKEARERVREARSAVHRHTREVVCKNKKSSYCIVLLLPSASI